MTNRRDLLKLSPLAFASAVGYVALDPAARGQGPLEGAANGAGLASFNVRTYGAAGDGKTVDTLAINKAIEAVAAAGGGTLVFPAGVYVCFTIRLKSYVDLYLERGCTILAADSPQVGQTTGYNGGVYDPGGPAQAWEPYQDYGHNHWKNSLFYAEDQHDFSIIGPGLIWGRGLSNGYGSEIRGAGNKAFIAEQAGVGNKALAFKNCRNVLLRDIQILKGGHFALLATGVDNLTIDNVLVDTDRDGFDIDCCRNVRVSNCTVNSPWDDGICPKSSYALGYTRPTENVTIANCYVSGCWELGSVLAGTWKRLPENETPHNGRIKCGTESNGGFRNIAITNCVCEGSRGVAIETSDGALVEDIAISNITMRGISDVPLFLRLNRRNRGPKETMRPGVLQRVMIANVVSHDAPGTAGSLLVGVPGNKIEDVKITNSYFGTRAEVPAGAATRVVPELEDGYPDPVRFGATPSSGFFVRHLKNLEMSHVEIAPDAGDTRPAFWLEDVTRADFFAVTAPEGRPNFALRKVSDLRVLWSRAAKGDVNEGYAESGSR